MRVGTGPLVIVGAILVAAAFQALSGLAWAAPLPRGGPPMTLDQFMNERRPQDQRILDANISKMRRLLQVTADDDPQKPDFYFRLGELYAEKLRTFAAQARDLESRIAVAAPAERPALENQRRGYENGRQKWLLEAVKAYISATKFRTYQRMDGVLYELVQLLTSAGKEDQAREFYLRLQRDFPTSTHLSAAAIALGDGACGARRLDDAVALYERVEQLPGEKLRTYATYAKGWCYLDLGRVQEALESFVTVVVESSPSPLRQEAMKDVVRAYARAGSPERAWDFFRKVDAAAASAMMRSLVARYRADGKSAEAARAAELVRAQGLDVGAPGELQ